MKPLCTLVFVASVGFAGPLIITDPILINGSGSWFSEVIGGDYGQTVGGGGTNGTDGASFSYSSDCPGSGGPNVNVYVTGLTGCAHYNGLGATIDSFYSLYYSVSINGDFGAIDLYTSGGALIASADLTGWINVTHYTNDGHGDISGTFTIGAPEPTTMLSTGMVVIIVAALALRKRSAVIFRV